MKKRILPFKNHQIQITDPLLSHYQSLISEKVLPHQWDILNDRVEGAEKSHCLSNFAIAAGDMPGIHYGMVFQDSDIYKWLEAVSYIIDCGNGQHFIPFADEVIDLIARAQQPDGYLNTYYTINYPGTRFTNLMEGHELYCAGHLIEAAVAYYTATNKRKLLEVAIRFADLICRTFGEGDSQNHGVPGHQEIELALVKLYRTTGEQRYLDTAAYFIRQRGVDPEFLPRQRNEQADHIFPELSQYDPKYSQSHQPPIQQTDIEGHAVRAMYMCAAMADIALETNDTNLEEACKRLWCSAVERRMYITGSLGSSGELERFTTDYDLPNDRNYSETCAAAGLMMFSHRMAVLTEEAQYYDAVELALHNTLLAGISFNGDRYFYVNPLEVWPDNCLPHTALSHVKPQRQEWFSVACCPTNIARTLASLGQYIYAYKDDTVYIQQLISSHLSAHCEITVEGSLTSGHYRIQAKGCHTLKIRIPWYAECPACSVNGTEVPLQMEQGYAVFSINGRCNIVLDLHTKPRWISARQEVRADTGKVAAMFGPFVYCLEEADNGAHLEQCAVLPQAPITISNPILTIDIPTLQYDGYRVTSTVEKLYDTARLRVEDCSLTAVPYCLWGNRKPGEMMVWQKLRF